MSNLDRRKKTVFIGYYADGHHKTFLLNGHWSDESVQRFLERRGMSLALSGISRPTLSLNP